MSLAEHDAKEQIRRQLSIIGDPVFDLDPPGAIHLWVKRDEKAKFGKWFGSLDDAVEFAIEERGRADVYVCGGLRRPAPANILAGREVKDLDGIVGFLGDFDVRPGAFASIEDARLFAWGVFHAIPPSMMVLSGGGLQAWWLLTEPWTFAYPEERKKAIDFARRFGATLKEAGRAKGIHVDSVHDLARVFRLAGTFNRKIPGNPRPTILELPAEGTSVRRYELNDLEQGLVGEEFTPASADAVPTIGYLVLSPDRRPPEDALLSLVTNHERARLSWERKRTDLIDQSGSSYNFSLAVLALQHGWTDQEVADLLVAWRVKHGEDLKTDRNGTIRQDWYQRTLLKAKRIIEVEKAKVSASRSRSSSAVAVVSDAPKKVVTPDEARGVIRETWDVEILRVEKVGTGTDRAKYALVLPGDRRGEVGTAAAMLDQKRIRAALFEAGLVAAPLKPAAWNDVVAALARLVEEIAPDDDEDTETARWIAEFVGGTEGTGWDAKWKFVGEHGTTLWGRLRSRAPWFVLDDRLAINLAHFRLEVFDRYGEGLTARALGQRLRRLGFEQTRLTARHGGEQFRQFYWLSPPEWDPYKAGGRGLADGGDGEEGAKQ